MCKTYGWQMQILAEYMLQDEYHLFIALTRQEIRANTPIFVLWWAYGFYS